MATANAVSKCLLLQRQQAHKISLLPLICRCSFSSTFETGKTRDAPINDEPRQHKQDFVKMQFEPGEWDPDRTDPLHRPVYKSRARIMSAEDFAARPQVGFEEEFDSLYDGMVVLSWLDGPTQDKIYQEYLDEMTSMAQTSKREKNVIVTSHEYVMRVIAQKYRITEARVAAIVKLKHNEEQILKEHGPQEIRTHLQDYVDSKIKDNIERAYRAHGEMPPENFEENPTGVSGMGDVELKSQENLEISDLHDVHALQDATTRRESNKARSYLDNYHYKEDVDENQVDVKVSRDCHALIKAQKHFSNLVQKGKNTTTETAEENPKPRRPRWKYVAKIVNTQENKKKGRFRKSKKQLEDEKIQNILTEHDGQLRIASLQELKNTSWKPIRNVKEFLYADVKDAWLNRVVNGEQDGWGRQKPPPPKAEDEKSDEAKESSAAESENAADAEAGDVDGSDADVTEPSNDESNEKSDEDPSTTK